MGIAVGIEKGTDLLVRLAGRTAGGRNLEELMEQGAVAADARCEALPGREGIMVLAVTVRNGGGEMTCLDDLAVDMRIAGIDGGAAADGRLAADGEEWYALLPLDGECRGKLLVMPYGDTRLDLCENIRGGGVRCHLDARCPAMAVDGERTWRFLISTVRSDDQVASVLLGFGHTPLSIMPGANAMRTVAHHFGDYESHVRVSHQLLDDTIAATITDGLLSGLTCLTGGVEAIASGHPFGHASVHTTDGLTVSTDDRSRYSDAEGDLCIESGGLRLTVRFRCAHDRLRYELEVANLGDQALTLDDVAVPMPLNSEMAEGVNPAERLIRHSQVAGDNSFLLGVPADNTPPYLLCTPAAGTMWQAFDRSPEDSSGPSRGYTLHMQGLKVAQDACSHEGGRWRLPVDALRLEAGQSKRYGLDFQWVSGYGEARKALVEAGNIDIKCVPGLSVPNDQDLMLLLTGRYDDVTVEAEHPSDTSVRLVRSRTSADDGEATEYLFRIHMGRLGENRLAIRYGAGRVGWLECFSTLPLDEVIEARAEYIADCQCRDETKWYDGLLCDRNTLTGEILDPDHHGQMPWRTRYAIASDDPGLSRPAFLSAKNAEVPDARQIKALDRYCARFVWGGLQRTDDEEYPYAVYGVPDWHELRNSRNLNVNERLHVWRIYDYPHVALLWFNMYRIAKANPHDVELEAAEYLRRAYGTFLAMYQYPLELEQSYPRSAGLSSWSPYKTGLYNELVIADVIDALRAEGMAVPAKRLEYHWGLKAGYFIREAQDLFGSEYPFDTTGFESTQAVVDWGRAHATGLWNDDGRSLVNYTPAQVEAFDRRQRACNIACRGSIESAYYLTGSDIRGDSAAYTLSYMSQMGGQALMRDALYAQGDPFPLLRLANASLLSSWALVNAGNQAGDYGYWYPGKANNGASSGGFEPLPFAQAWLGQDAYRGVWRFGSETDLGFCGYLRGAATVVGDDPDFGRVVYGGTVAEGSLDGPSALIRPCDGVRRRFHIIAGRHDRLHVLAEGVRIECVEVVWDGRGVDLVVRFEAKAAPSARIAVSAHDAGTRLSADHRAIDSQAGGIDVGGRDQIRIECWWGPNA